MNSKIVVAFSSSGNGIDITGVYVLFNNFSCEKSTISLRLLAHVSHQAQKVSL